MRAASPTHPQAQISDKSLWHSAPLLSYSVSLWLLCQQSGCRRSSRGHKHGRRVCYRVTTGALFELSRLGAASQAGGLPGERQNLGTASDPRRTRRAAGSGPPSRPGKMAKEILPALPVLCVVGRRGPSKPHPCLRGGCCPAGTLHSRQQMTCHKLPGKRPAPFAQWTRRRTSNPKIVGSSPTGGVVVAGPLFRRWK